MAAYHARYPLLIDPVVLLYSTYLGGSSSDFGYGIAVDGAGQAYVTGYTSSADFPLKNPLQGQKKGDIGDYDIFVTKLRETGLEPILYLLLDK